MEESPLPHLCARCAGRVEVVIPPSCPTCGHPRYHETEDVCPHCLDFTARYAEARVVVMAKGPVRPLIHELKYHQGRQVLADIRAALEAAPEFVEWIRGARLVPVPLHPAKERHRGYNQSRLIAEVFAEASGGGTTVHDILRRVRFTESQTRFDRADRLRALEGVFALKAQAVVEKSARYVLVDDVLTTGSTLSHCAEVLLQRGCKQVDAAAFGHG